VALLGGQARRLVFQAPIREFAVPETVLAEVTEHLPRLALKLGMGPSLLGYALDLLPLRAYPLRAYRASVVAARKQIADRDPEDVHVRALALSLDVPAWSNDRDFARSSAETSRGSLKR
jgi:predicted nucleic acid-binding protein